MIIYFFIKKEASKFSVLENLILGFFFLNSSDFWWRGISWLPRGKLRWGGKSDGPVSSGGVGPHEMTWQSDKSTDRQMGVQLRTAHEIRTHGRLPPPLGPHSCSPVDQINLLDRSSPLRFLYTRTRTRSRHIAYSMTCTDIFHGRVQDLGFQKYGQTAWDNSWITIFWADIFPQHSSLEVQGKKNICRYRTIFLSSRILMAEVMSHPQLVQNFNVQEILFQRRFFPAD